jgi:hypothetical protein
VGNLPALSKPGAISSAGHGGGQGGTLVERNAPRKGVTAPRAGWVLSHKLYVPITPKFVMTQGLGNESWDLVRPGNNHSAFCQIQPSFFLGDLESSSNLYPTNTGGCTWCKVIRGGRCGFGKKPTLLHAWPGLECSWSTRNFCLL